MTPRQWATRDERATVWPGRHWPLGATWSPDATNFAIHAPAATGVWIAVRDENGHETQHPLTEHTMGIWHAAIPGLPVGAVYGVHADGPNDPDHGLRFDRDISLLDPYARAVCETSDGPRCVVTVDDFDWEDERPIKRRWRDTTIYELHVKGFTTLHDRIPEEIRGTYAALGHPVVTEYLNDLGITAVELLPVHQFFSEPDVAERGLVNYWGYNSIGFFAPHGAYAAGGDRGEQVNEFKQMVKSLHAAGIEVILDVVYNHTAEGGRTGPTWSFRGLDDRGFYMRKPHSESPDAYWDVTGCGNTVAANHPPVLRMIMDSLRYWVEEMHIDGFRFDLMSALTRTNYAVDMQSHLLTTIAQDPVLRYTKLIAEPWDASASGYRVGEYPPPWVEWNDHYRDALRDFWRGHESGVRDVATRLAGSSDLYADDGRSPYHSLNFVTSHDGFTLRDLVSYNHKHNEANGEDNRDGTDNNRSWNCGVEGPTDDPAILALRRRQAANIAMSLCLSAGVPMLVAGDERGRTQQGNNNAYCQDNEVSWVDWRADDAWLDVYDLVKKALRLRRDHPALRQRHFYEGRPALVGGPKDVAWMHPDGREMTDADWADDANRVIGMFVSGNPLRSPGPNGEQQRDDSFLVWLNGADSDREIALMDNEWVHAGEVVLSTAPEIALGTPVHASESFTLPGRSVVLMQATDSAP